ncbi:MAG: protein-L-isoaspartate O-methyltransferase, partial [Proteobacteria bacterium]|nr:protein-L-isoaspartate O-methyltransferase [Pseudomonadota bacterium]
PNTPPEPSAILAWMSELAVRADARAALDVGTGSGYQAAVLAELVPRVDSLELSADLARTARERLDALGYANVRVHRADARLGWSSAGPYDAIVVACAAPRVPEALLEQLAPGGRLVAPVGRYEQRLCVFEKDSDGLLESRLEGWVAFVPMR